MELIPFLTLDVSDPENIPEIMSFVWDELEKLKLKGFSGHDIHRLDGIVGKFIELAEYCECTETEMIQLNVNELISSVLKHERSAPTDRTKECKKHFEKLTSLIMSVYNQIIRKLHDSGVLSEFNLLYNPNLSDKKNAILLIEEAIKHIERDDQLSDRQKNQIIKLLIKALDNLKKPKTNWTSFFGNIQQAIIILGALGSLTGGITGAVAILKANEKIIQSKQIIETTSINQYYNHNIQINYSKDQYFIEGAEQSPSDGDINLHSLAIPEKTTENSEGEK